MNVTQDGTKAVAQFFLAEVREITLAAIACAAIVGVAVLLEFRRDRAIVIRTVQETRESKIVLAILGLVVTLETSLYLLEQVRADEWNMRTVVELVFPNELAFVEGILEQPFQIPFSEKLAKFSVKHLPHAGQRILTGSVEFEHALGDGRFLRVNFNRVFELVVRVAQRRAARIDALFGLLAHSFAYLLAQVFDVVAGDDHLNPVYELGLRFRVFADDLPFFGQVNFNFQVFECDAIAEVAVEPIGLFHDGRAAGGILAEETNHFAKLLAARGLGRLHVNEFAHDFEFMCVGIFPKEL